MNHQDYLHAPIILFHKIISYIYKPLLFCSPVTNPGKNLHPLEMKKKEENKIS